MIGFGYETMRAFKAKLPQLKVYWLVMADKKTKKYPSVESMIKKAKAANLDGLDLNSGFPIDKEFVQKVHDAGLKIYTWTVDEVDVAKKRSRSRRWTASPPIARVGCGNSWGFKTHFLNACFSIEEVVETNC